MGSADRAVLEHGVATKRRHSIPRAASLLELDPGLGETLEPSACEEAARRALVRVEAFEAGVWRPGFAERGGYGAGLLICDGVLVRRTLLDERSSAEPFGVGDIVFPWHPPHADAWVTESWRALTPVRVALLDEVLMRRIAPFPPVLLALAERSARRARFLAALGLTRRMRRTEDRLLFLFLLLAERWGRVRADGIRLALPVTHELLGELVGAQRQTVTTALGAMRAAGLVSQLPGGDWLVARSAYELPAQAAGDLG